jgi:hypothetical protein
MSRLKSLKLAVCAVLAIGAGLTLTAAQAEIKVYTTTLSGANEAVPNDSFGTGSATVTIDSVLFSMRVETTFSGLSGTTTASHIHCCTLVPYAGTVGVATQTPTFSLFPLGVTSGSYDHTFDMTQASSYNASFITTSGGTPATAFAALVAGMDIGKAYLNIHTTYIPGGEIRGFLAPVPEPEIYAMLGVGLGLMGWVGRRKKLQAA